MWSGKVGTCDGKGEGVKEKGISKLVCGQAKCIEEKSQPNITITSMIRENARYGDDSCRGLHRTY